MHSCISVQTLTRVQSGVTALTPAIFNPTKLDCDQWCEAFKAAGMKRAVITAKHHDGFCLWPSEYTDYCIKNSPYKTAKAILSESFPTHAAVTD